MIDAGRGQDGRAINPGPKEVSHGYPRAVCPAATGRAPCRQTVSNACLVLRDAGHEHLASPVGLLREFCDRSYAG